MNVEQVARDFVMNMNNVEEMKGHVTASHRKWWCITAGHPSHRSPRIYEWANRCFPSNMIFGRSR